MVSSQATCLLLVMGSSAGQRCFRWRPSPPGGLRGLSGHGASYIRSGRIQAQEHTGVAERMRLQDRCRVDRYGRGGAGSAGAMEPACWCACNLAAPRITLCKSVPPNLQLRHSINCGAPSRFQTSLGNWHVLCIVLQSLFRSAAVTMCLFVQSNCRSCGERRVSCALRWRPWLATCQQRAEALQATCALLWRAAWLS